MKAKVTAMVMPGEVSTKAMQHRVSRAVRTPPSNRDCTPRRAVSDATIMGRYMVLADRSRRRLRREFLMGLKVAAELRRFLYRRLAIGIGWGAFSGDLYEWVDVLGAMIHRRDKIQGIEQCITTQMIGSGERFQGLGGYRSTVGQEKIEENVDCSLNTTSLVSM